MMMVALQLASLLMPVALLIRRNEHRHKQAATAELWRLNAESTSTKVL
jgi:hypothetical protein